MIKKLLTVTLLVSLLLHADMPTVNYDNQFDNEEMSQIDETMLSSLKLESLVFQEKLVDGADGKKIKKNVPVKQVKAGEKVVYINRILNTNSESKRNIVVKNPIPYGTEYVVDSAVCDHGCVISYSVDGGETLSNTDTSGEGYNYIEFHFKQIPANKELRMGFRAIIQ
ncbi:MAG: hypothetical protein K0U38_01725 [Epsilonproteobacteria bacterium]|nr:hypothetical protein [Campylobacterota bacterium]